MSNIIEFPGCGRITAEEIETHWENLRQTAEGLLIIGGKGESYAEARSARMVTDARQQFAEQFKSGELKASEYVAAVVDTVLDEAYRIAGRPRPPSP